jgi:copper(I)-binding protein
MDLYVKVEPTSEETLQIDLFFTQATQATVQAVIETVSVALTPQ